MAKYKGTVELRPHQWLKVDDASARKLGVPDLPTQDTVIFLGFGEKKINKIRMLNYQTITD